MERHPEGGWFCEIYRSEEVALKSNLQEGFSGDRNFSTSIYFLLEGEDVSVFHRIKSDEIWHFYTGTSALEILWVEKGQLVKRYVGNDFEKGEQFQVIVPKNLWFAAQLVNKDGFALVGCTVSPGFYFEDFEMADERLLNEFPNLAKEIQMLVKK